MATQTRLFGYWISSVDEKSAKEAIKMAGLPVLIMGANAGLTALIALSSEALNLKLALSCAVISLLFIVVAFRIRAEKSGWMPLALALFAAFLAINVFGAYIAVADRGAVGMSGLQIVTSWIVPLICAVLMVAGFKGWLWLRANDLPRPL